jgi:hypothetical protein
MVELEIADSTEDDSLWLFLQVLGIKLSGAVHDDDDNGEYREPEKELEDHLPSNETTSAEMGDVYAGSCLFEGSSI